MVKFKRILGLLLRVLALTATVSAAIVMATSHEKSNLFTFSFEAKYSDTAAFKYFVIANIIGSVYGFLVLFLPSESLLWRLVVVMDMIIIVLLTSSISASLAIAHVGKKGNSNAGWQPICGQFHQYCNQVAGALAAGFIGLIIYMVLLLYSIHTVINPLLLSKA